MGTIAARGSPAAGSARGRALVAWFARHRRPLAWRTRPTPYRIWVAEVLLQQTRVAPAERFFARFVRRFPDLATLARSREGSVLKAWEGAGYYARARHLRAAARLVRAEHGGELPRTVEELERLPGTGRYIARAVASLAFGVPVIALEANGIRVAARWTLERGDPRRPAVRRRLEAALRRDLPGAAAGRFNEALMELGETVCGPDAPSCGRCPVARWCRAFRDLDDPGRLPVRRPRARRPHVTAALVAVEAGGRWLVQRRPSHGLLGGLWEFPGGKVEANETPRAAARRELREETALRVGRLEPVGVVRHAYSHFRVDLHLFRARVPRATRLRRPDQRWTTPEAFARLPRPAATVKAAALLSRSGRPRPAAASPG